MALVRRTYRTFKTDSLPSNYFDSQDDQEIALFAAGCFWGVETLFRKRFDGPHLRDLRTVYAGDPDLRYPVYTNLGDHAEAIILKFDPSEISYEALVLYFFQMHDPTEKNRQGNDRGRQYRSCIWTFSESQDKTARRIRDRVSLHYKDHVDGSLCATKVLPARRDQIWTAERRHQRYSQKNPGGYHCASHYVREHIT